MPKSSIVVLALLALLLVPAHAGGGKLSWVKDYDAGLKQARETGKPAMVYFTADW